MMQHQARRSGPGVNLQPGNVLRTGAGQPGGMQHTSILGKAMMPPGYSAIGGAFGRPGTMRLPPGAMLPAVPPAGGGAGLPPGPAPQVRPGNVLSPGSAGTPYGAGGGSPLQAAMLGAPGGMPQPGGPMAGQPQRLNSMQAMPGAPQSRPPSSWLEQAYGVR